MEVKTETTRAGRREKPRTLLGGVAAGEAKGVGAVITNNAQASTARKNSPNTIRARRSMPPPIAKS